MCQSPLYVAQDLLRSEGFTDLEYIKKPGPKWNGPAIASGEADITMHFAGPVILQIEAEILSSSSLERMSAIRVARD